VLGARAIEHEVEQRHRDLVVDRLALLGVDERIDADVGHDQLPLERERAQLLGQGGGVLDRETVQLRAAVEDRLEPGGEVFLDRLVHGGFDPAQGSLPSGNYTSRMEHGNVFLLQAAVYFAAAVIAVMAAHRLGLGSVAGYLLAGIAIGPWGLKLIEQPEAIRA